jgi:hypothetical protein
MRMDDKGELTMKKIIVLVFAVLIGLMLLPTIQDAVTSGQEYNNNSTDEATSGMLDMVTLFYVLFIVLGAILFVVAETRGLGGN